MRSRRLTKKGRSMKSRSISLTVKGFAIFYLLFYTVSHFTSPTTAFFNDIERIHGSLSAAGDFGGDQPPPEVWDKSSLTFDGQETGGTCKTIFAFIKNGGDGDMEGPSEFEVWWITKGNPKKGEKVYDSGEIPPLAHGEETKLTYDPGTNPNGTAGVYKFRAFQRPGHANKYDQRFDLWSDSITIAEGMCGAEGVQGLNSNHSEIKDSLENEKTGSTKEDEKNNEMEKETRNSGKNPSKTKEDQVKNEESEQKEDSSDETQSSGKSGSMNGNNQENHDGSSEQNETNDQSTGSKDEGSTTTQKPPVTKKESNSEDAGAMTSETKEKGVNKSKSNDKSSVKKETEEMETKNSF